MLAPDVYDSLFEKPFFESQVYTVWSRGDRSWSLHCYGDPGCGKVGGALGTGTQSNANSRQTTLAAMTVKRLRARDSSPSATPVASIYIEKDISGSTAVFLEDFLSVVFNQLPNVGKDSNKHMKLYTAACRNGESISKRTKLLRMALAFQLSNYGHTFLVIDGYDRVDEGVQVLLDRELEDLRAHRLRVLLTRRVPVFELPREKNCDGLDRDGEECEEYNLQIYWVREYAIKFLRLSDKHSRVKHVKHLESRSVNVVALHYF